jgi:CBS domain containing-hemolysin-like protein
MSFPLSLSFHKKILKSIATFVNESAALIVIFGQILPFALSTRYGLAIGAQTLFITRFFMFITFPVSYPLGWLLDRILGK